MIILKFLKIFLGVVKYKMKSRLLKLEEVAEYLGVTINTLYSWTYQRKIPHFKIGRLLKFDEREIELWLRRNHVDQK